jgi:hypothetical protein
MEEPLETQYFNWLYSQVSDLSERLPTLRFCNLLNQLHHIEFEWTVLCDDNRVEDGRDLRREFLDEFECNDDGSLSAEGCSVLEMLIAFSRKASFETDEPPKDWFWVMINNLGLGSINDSTPLNERAVEEIIWVFVNRMYDENGHGGIFPLNHTQKNQREVEIWYQFNEYLLEIDYD